MLVLVAAVVVVIVAAGVGAIWMLEKNEGTDNSDYATFWAPKVGKYAEYVQVNESLLNYNWTFRCTVLSVDAPNLMQEWAWYMETGDLFDRNNWSAPMNLTFGLGFDISHEAFGVEVTEIGVENLTTAWGVRTCICYGALWPNGYTDHFWVHNGIMVKDVADPREQDYQGGTWLLKSTNIREITH